MARIEVERERRANGDWRYRAIDSTYGHVSFGAIELADKLRLLTKCLDCYLQADAATGTYKQFFWNVLGGLDDASLPLIVERIDETDAEQTDKLIFLPSDCDETVLRMEPPQAFLNQYIPATIAQDFLPIERRYFCLRAAKTFAQFCIHSSIYVGKALYPKSKPFSAKSNSAPQLVTIKRVLTNKI